MTLLLAGAASADEAELPASPPPASESVPTESYWYGDATLAVDGISTAVLLGGIVLPPLALVGGAGLVFGGPAVHLANDRPGAAAASFGLRTLVPIGAAVIGYNLAGSCNRTEREPGAILGPCFLHGVGEAATGALVGLGVAVAVDAGLLARGTREGKPPPPASAAPRVTSVAPSFDPQTRATSVGVGGTF